MEDSILPGKITAAGLNAVIAEEQDMGLYVSEVGVEPYP